MSWDRLSEQKSQGGIGFRMLHKFNLALLMKQSWRLLTKPESLIAKVLKARYFPSCSILDALLGANPSYTWRSIHASMDFLKKGIRAANPRITTVVAGLRNQHVMPQNQGVH